ncbi:asparagine synthase (glutamine-hydrolyzing) [Tessaracoccus rhinocerotis]|uniref:asparagine synthase (glutamine-hydrolyzing) n=1 Tax=Tessaracoccus rhinocerotis TaxID=1689449 RepID=A0A553K1P8_9ACTN|nr:asparagine synthase (glutamine-hydrolyzing) [Tessaracoccus rhinocerotis]TRY18631.1 asparagine synthase (glutamine-hydrolyzing) [Tessaracoccus rhinocerotis]
MCGIAGVYHARASGPVDVSRLRIMAEVLAHRGPDDRTTWIQGPLGLAHTRLSIIDVEASRQPMHAVDGSWSLVFNGEIFNYKELRRNLEYPFETDGDTEVLLAGLVLHGISFVKLLRGQFAFAAFHNASGTLHLARDRLGVLPLYYHQAAKGLTFASEAKAINIGFPHEITVDHDSLDAYLTARSVPAPYTLFKGISKLEPGHRAEYHSDGTLTLCRYWEPPPVESSANHRLPTVVDEAEQQIRDAVGAAMVADVPVGAMLSGGVDSSLIVAVMKEIRGDAPIDTFSAGFGDARVDELSWARRVSEHVGTRHHEVEVRAEDFLELWPRLTWHRDAPMSEPADTAVFRLAELARHHVKVVLSGEGGDELFGGYPKYRYASMMSVSAIVPAGLRGEAGRMLESRLPPRLSRARVMLRALAEGSKSQQLAAWFAPFTSSERRVLLGTEPPSGRSRNEPPGADDVDRLLRHDLASWLPDNLLERGDRMCMAASLELRPPLLDHHLVEFAFRLPSKLKVRGGRPKWLLKEVARRYLPTEVVDRRKVGFRVPLDTWLRSDLRESAWDRLTGTGSYVGSIFNRNAVRELLESHERGASNEENRIWTLLSLEVWHETCISGVRNGWKGVA